MLKLHPSLYPYETHCSLKHPSKEILYLAWLHLLFSWWLLFSGTAELFATCAKMDIRVWHTLSNRELLRITVPNMTCHSIDFMRDGKSIISGNVDVPRFGFLLGLWLWILAPSLNTTFYM